MRNKSIGPIALFFIFLLCSGYYFFTWSSSSKERNADQHVYTPVQDPLRHCTTPYGTLLGYAVGVPAFSNCHRDYRAMQMVIARFGHPGFVMDYNDGKKGNFYSGAPWASMEYATRFLFHHKGATYFEVPTPQEVWMTRHFHNPLETMDGKVRRLYDAVQKANHMEAATPKARKRLAPKFADVVVWPAQAEKDLPEGHIAVVVRVEDDVGAAGGEDRLRELRGERLQPQLVYIAEQNFDNTPWEGRNYSRVLRFRWKNGKEAVLQDPLGLSVLGWVRMGKRKVVDYDEEGLYNDGDL